MWHSAVSDQWTKTTKKVAGKRKVVPIKSQFQATKEVTDDASKADPNAIPSPDPSPHTGPDPSPHTGPGPNRIYRRTLTPGSFKKMYTPVTARGSLEEKTIPNRQKILPVPSETLSRFYLTPTLESGEGKDQKTPGLTDEDSQGSDNDPMSLANSSEEENHLPVLDMIEEDEKDMDLLTPGQKDTDVPDQEIQCEKTGENGGDPRRD